MIGEHWAVCQALSSRVHRVRPEIEKIDRGTFLPTYARVWASGGKLSARERQLFPGYLFFRTAPKEWGAVANVDGVYRVLKNGEKAARISDADMGRIVLEHVTGAHNEVDLGGLDRVYGKRKRQRRPRASKRARSLPSCVFTE
ncbi:transcription antitermination factor NusG [Bradyrhizobium ottawaense]|uniref:transcription termination/antitermination protein NusG n=1 Tax=Bradyrhizobium ottawaense TaxID=931866 RepID=UPI003832D6EB